jgi:hypothetical protein
LKTAGDRDHCSSLVRVHCRRRRTPCSSRDRHRSPSGHRYQKITRYVKTVSDSSLAD